MQATAVTYETGWRFQAMGGTYWPVFASHARLEIDPNVAQQSRLIC